MTSAARLLVLDYHLLVADIIEDLESRGFEVGLVDPSGLSVAGFEHAISTFRPQAVFAINHASVVAALCGRFALPYISWSIDPLPEGRLERLDWVDPERCLSYAHQPRLVSALEAVGLSAALLPLAAPGRRRVPVTDPAALEPFACHLSFVGSSLQSEEVRLDRALDRLAVVGEPRRKLVELVDELLDAHEDDLGYGGFAASPERTPSWVHELVPVGEVPRFLEYLDGFLGRRHRLRCVARLEPLSVQVWGDIGWQGRAHHYRGLAEHDREVTCIYNASGINLDLPRLYQRDIVTMRVFDALAAGAFVLSEASDGLRGLFTDGEEVAMYPGPGSLRQATERWADDLPGRRAVAESGRTAVLERHLIRHRIDRILTDCQERGFF